jgi:hypothetical protein
MQPASASASVITGTTAAIWRKSKVLQRLDMGMTGSIGLT